MSDRVDLVLRSLNPTTLSTSTEHATSLLASAWIEHRPFARWIVEATRPRILVELGTHWGTSYFAFCDAVRKLRLDTRCHAVDTWAGDEHSGHYGEEVYDNVSRINASDFASFSTLMRMTFDEAVQHFRDGSVDLLHIDGYHTYDRVKFDFETWLPKLSERAVVLLHDSQERGGDFGVWRLVSELSSRFRVFEFFHGHGLAVVGVGATLPEAIDRLLRIEPNADGNEALRRLWSSLGCLEAERLSVVAEASRLRSRADAEHQNAAAAEAELKSAHAAAILGLAAERDQVVADLAGMRAEASALRVQARAEREQVGRQIRAYRDYIHTQASESLDEATARDRERHQANLTAHELRLTLEQAERRTGELEAALAAMHDSTSWRFTSPLRDMSATGRRLLARARYFGLTAPHAVRHLLSNPRLGRRFVASMRSAGPRGTWQRIVRRLEGPPDLLTGSVSPNRYDAWLRVNPPNEAQESYFRRALTRCSRALPLISVIMPVYRTPISLLDQAIESVLRQIHENWELCIVDDGSGDATLADTLRSWVARDARIKVTTLTRNAGISVATNAAVQLATGEYLAFLDHDDELSVDALAEVALRCATEPEIDILYSDDDKIDLAGTRSDPQFKPSWSPILLLSYMYLSHLLVVRRKLFEQVGGCRPGYEGAQDYDLALRVTEAAARIDHIPRILYHWRVVPGSTASSADAKPQGFEAGRRAVADALSRRGIDAVTSQPAWAVKAKLGIFSLAFADKGPSVSIIIPTRNKVDLLQRCISSLEMTSYANYEIVVADNGSDDPETLRYLASLKHRVLRLPNSPGRGFSYAWLNNQAAAQADSQYLLFLNNDTEVRNPEWLSQMMGYMRMPGVGAVGARLLFPNGTVQHAGIVHGYHAGTMGHAFKGYPANEIGYLGYAKVARECSAVTGACLLTPKALFNELGGFDEGEFAVAYNDVDYCYRIVDGGRRCVYCADAELLHFEGSSRGLVDHPRELAAIRRRYRGRTDPWYNPNLSLDDEHYKIRPYHHPVDGHRPVRAVLITHNLNLEGAPNSQLELTVGLTRQGVIDPVVFATQDGKLRPRYEDAGIPVRLIQHPLLNTHDMQTYLARVDALSREFASHRAEIVYANTLQTFWAIDAARRAGLPTLWNVRESEPPLSYFDWVPVDFRSRAYDCLRYPYRVVFVANSTKRNWEGLETSFNYTVIHNGLDREIVRSHMPGKGRAEARERLGVSDTETVFVLLGTVAERKGQIDLVDALMRMAPEDAEQSQIFIVGDREGDYSSALHARVAKLPPYSRDRIHVIPETNQALLYFVAADVALCTSRIESYPRVVLEAMALGLPLITTPVFGIREQVQEGVNGLFYEPGDSARLASLLSLMINDRKLRGKLAGNSLAVLDSTLDYQDMLDAYGALFKQARFSTPTSRGA